MAATAAMIPTPLKMCHSNKELAVFKKHKCTVLWCKMQKHYKWNVTHKMLKHCTQNNESFTNKSSSKYRVVPKHHLQNNTEI